MTSSCVSITEMTISQIATPIARELQRNMKILVQLRPWLRLG